MNILIKRGEKFGVPFMYQIGFPMHEIDVFFKSLYPQEMNELRHYISCKGQLLFKRTVVPGLLGDFYAGPNNEPLIRIYKGAAPRLEKNGGLFHHEYTHFLQWKRGDIHWDAEERTYWKGEEIDTSFANYNPTKQPWEIEAWGSQAEINKRYKKEMGGRRKKFLGLF